MKMKISILLLTFVLILGSSVVVSAGYDVEGLPEITITTAHTEAPRHDSYVHAAHLTFKEHVERNSQGKITVDVIPGGELGSSPELIEQVKMGVIEGACSTSGHLASDWAQIQTVDIPYLFRSVDHALYVLRNTEFAEEFFANMLEKTGLRSLAVWDNGGFRNFTNSVRPITNPSDMEGLRFRTMDNPAHMEMVELLGAEPITVDWLELYTALETGVVDGQENAIPTIDLGSLQEVQEYLVLDRHVFSWRTFFFNDNWFQGLPPVYQRILEAGAREAELKGEKQNRILREVLLEKFIERGMEVYDPTTEELEMFREATQDPVAEFIRDEAGDYWVDGILEASDAALDALGY